MMRIMLLGALFAAVTLLNRATANEAKHLELHS